MSNPIPKINENNEVVGTTTITEAKQNGWPRRVTRAVLFNELGEVLLQKRSEQSILYPGLWDCSGGHVDVGEDHVEAGRREVFEELGINVSLIEIGSPVFFEQTFYVICIGRISSDTFFVLKTNEVTQTKWLSVKELDVDIESNPEQFTPWFVHIWNNSKETLLNTI